MHETRHTSTQKKPLPITYGSSRSAFTGQPLELEPRRGSNVPRLTQAEEFPDRDQLSAKRQKTAHPQPTMSPNPHDLILSDEEDEVDRSPRVQRGTGPIIHEMRPDDSQAMRLQSKKSSHGMGPRGGLFGSQEFKSVEDRLGLNSGRSRQRFFQSNERQPPGYRLISSRTRYRPTISHRKITRVCRRLGRRHARTRRRNDRT